ncbi:MAG: YceI family protein [Deltaproteobacteria bacterium]|nr:YceI family protein [Deltaproteobacteria bacterium]
MSAMTKTTRTAALLGLLWASTVGAAPTTTSGRIELDGDSTLHPYKTQATSFDIALDAAQGASGSVPELLSKGQIRGATLTVAVKQLRSGEEKLDQNLQNAVRAKENPNITFEISKIEGQLKPDVSFPLKLTGKLRIAGVEQAEVIDAEGKLQGDALRLTGSKVLKMTDFNVEPPVLMMGMLKTADLVMIKFDVVVKAAPSK